MRARLEGARSEEGYTLIELLVAAAMGVVVMGVVALLVVAAVKGQPEISKQAQNITTARSVLDRMTHELRNGLSVTKAEPDEVSFRAYVRRSTCGGTTTLPASTPAIECQVTYTCTTTACSRTESAPATYTGTPRTILDGIDSSQVFTYVPEVTEASEASEVTYVKITLSLPEPDGVGAFTVSSGTSLRNATLGY